MIRVLNCLIIPRREAIILSSSLLMLGVAIPFDHFLSLFLIHNNWPVFSQFMDRSFFEGELFGFGDIPVLFYLTVLSAWLLSFSAHSPAHLRRWRPYLSYLVVHSLLTAVVVHLLKGVLARPRPSDVFGGGAHFQAWFDLRSPELHGWGRGSFPSGHTATVASLISVTYVLRHRYQLRWLWTSLSQFAVLGLVVAMAISRVMHGAHWLTDTIAAAGLSWWLADSIFHRLLCLPKQNEHLVSHHTPLWELRLFFIILPACFNLALALFALRLFAHNLNAWALLFLITSLGVAYVIFRSIGLWQERLFSPQESSKVLWVDPDSQPRTTLPPLLSPKPPYHQ